MKKLLISLIMGTFLVLPIQQIHAATLTPDERTLIIQLINLLMDQVKELQIQFNQLLAQEQANTAAIVNSIVPAPTGVTTTVAPIVVTPVVPVVVAPEVPIITMSFNGQEVKDKTITAYASNYEDKTYEWNVSYPDNDFTKFKCSQTGELEDTNTGSGRRQLRFADPSTHTLKINCLDLSGQVVASKTLTIVVK
jgi:hypothetical protein